MNATPPALLDGKRLLITGVLNRHSIAWHVADAAQRQGAEVVLSSFGRVLRHTRKAAALLPRPPEIVELDVIRPETIASAVAEAVAALGGLDGVLHSIAYGPPGTLDGSFVGASADGAAEAFTVSAHSLAALAHACRAPLRDGGGSIVGLTFASGVAWPRYNWMGVAKAALEAAGRYTALELGPDRIRVNLVSAGPLRTFAARTVPGYHELAAAWAASAPLGWDDRDLTPVADASCFLLSDQARAITGEVLHVDGGAHAVGASGASAAS